MPLDQVQPLLAFQPIPIEGTALQGYRQLGAHPEIVGDKRGASALLRYFRGPNGEVIELFEVDTSLGGAVFLDPSRQTERVKGQPAMLRIWQSNSGKALSALLWEENRRHIRLSVNRNVNKQGSYEQFLRLAESLPSATPAHPDAPLPRRSDLPPPFGTGPDFAAHPPK